MRKLSILSLTLLLILCMMSGTVFASGTSNSDDVNSKQIQMIKPKNQEEARKINDKIYEGNPTITHAVKVDSSSQTNDTVGLLAESLPYSFTFNFDSNLSSRTIDNDVDGGTIKIHSNGDWVDKPNEYEGSELAYYDITLYSGGTSLGTIRYDIGYAEVGTWNNVPSGNISFTMSKNVLTWSGAPYPSYDGHISGSGTVSHN